VVGGGGFGGSGLSAGAIFRRRAGGMNGVFDFGGFNFGSVKAAVMKIDLGPSSLIIGLMLISAILMILYLATYNKIATKGYDLKRLEADHQQLMSQYDIRNMKLAQVRSLTNMIVTARIADTMRKPATVEFVRGGDTVIASR
jgi:hypothetical protein